MRGDRDAFAALVGGVFAISHAPCLPLRTTVEPTLTQAEMDTACTVSAYLAFHRSPDSGSGSKAA